MAELNLTTLIGGVPFLDEGFRPEAALSAVLCVRLWSLGMDADTTDKQTCREILSPTAARECCLAAGVNTDIDLVELSLEQLSRVQATLERISIEMPIWAAALQLPIRFYGIDRPGVISASAPAFRQFIFLDRAAFYSERELAEQVIHEFAHNWLYLIEEFMPFFRKPSAVRHVLPSGTANRSSSEVIGAGHVAATLMLWYARSDATADVERCAVLRDYLDGCVSKLESLPRESFSASGTFLFDRLVIARERQ